MSKSSFKHSQVSKLQYSRMAKSPQPQTNFQEEIYRENTNSRNSRQLASERVLVHSRGRALHGSRDIPYEEDKRGGKTSRLKGEPQGQSTDVNEYLISAYTKSKHKMKNMKNQITDLKQRLAACEMIVINACQQTEIVKDSITQLARSRSQKTPVTPEFRGEEENQMLIDLTKSCIKQTARFVPPERDRGNSFTMRDLKEPEEEKVVVQDNIKEDGGQEDDKFLIKQKSRKAERDSESSKYSLKQFDLPYSVKKVSIPKLSQRLPDSPLYQSSTRPFYTSKNIKEEDPYLIQEQPKAMVMSHSKPESKEKTELQKLVQELNNYVSLQMVHPSMIQSSTDNAEKKQLRKKVLDISHRIRVLRGQ